MSWESTQTYYRAINEEVRQRLGGLHSASLFLYSVDFHEVEALQSAGQWDEAGRVLAHAARRLERAGADCLVLCTNTMHRVARDIERAIEIPLLHIADATATAVGGAGISRVGLLGTRFTMEEDFYRGRLAERHGLEVVVPEASARKLVDRVIYEELCRGQVLHESRVHYRQVIERLVDRGAQGVILGCTEISLLVQPEDAAVPLFDTTVLHAREAVEWSMR